MNEPDWNVVATELAKAASSYGQSAVRPVAHPDTVAALMAASFVLASLSRALFQGMRPRE